MSDMEGNPNYGPANMEPRNDPQLTDAVLALAYEQRTANLIAFLPYVNQISSQEVQDQIMIGISRRLGASS